jgi:uncharacterized protein YyaL (SSP411 family)
MTNSPTAFAGLLMALDFFKHQTREIVIAFPGDDKAAAAPFLDILRSHYLTNRVLAVVGENHDRETLEKIMPIVRNRPAMDGTATAYVCENHTCRKPTTDPQEFARLIGVEL